jgi:NitT/TauT family transport system substrate-binding protein
MRPATGRWAALRGRGLTALVLGLAGLGASACGGGDGKLGVALNWKPEPEFGGLYAALDGGAFARRGLDVEITGGPGAPVVQMISAGQVEFGVVSADEVMIARDRGADVVAVFATYQTNPQGLMVHAERGIASLADLFAAGGRLAVEPGLPYVKFLQRSYDLSHVEIVPYGYSIAPFLQDPEMSQQVFVTAEPIAARRQGAHPQVFLIAQSGYDPYAAVYATRGALVRDDPGRVRAFVAALREGWRRYLDDPAATNARMGRLNPEMDAESFRLAAQAQAPLVEDDWTRAHGLGAMSGERWTALGGQLLALGLIDRAPRPDACWVDVDAPTR